MWKSKELEDERECMLSRTKSHFRQTQHTQQYYCSASASRKRPMLRASELLPAVSVLHCDMHYVVYDNGVEPTEEQVWGGGGEAKFTGSYLGL